ncbi:MAG TPA: hypothetical protein VN442_04500 [Bryobacteraceae bacterium]|nr:hypothetical protein [Bryobacteraceae bacterium]
MAHLTQSGRLGGQLILLLFISTSIALPQSSQLTCTASAVPTLVRTEGVVERVGDILLQCSGGSPGTVVSGNLTLFLPVNITNRIDADSVALQVALTVQAGATTTPFSGRISNQSISFTGLQFTVPESRTVTMRISNLRVNASQLGTAAGQILQAQITTTTGVFSLVNNAVVVGRTESGLLATLAPSGIPSVPSPLPADLTISNLFARGTIFTSTRFTEGFPAAFEPKDATSDTGTRLVVRYRDVPAGTRLFVPDVVAGSDAAIPTAGGDLGGTQSGGEYEPGSGALLLARVISPDVNGAGGQLAYTPGAPGSGSVAFERVREVPVEAGIATVVYEVVDANPGRRQTAQFPTFIGAPADCLLTMMPQTVSFGPVSTTPAASTSAPVPRFVAADPAPDCSTAGDCQDEFFPRLVVDAQPLVFTAIAGGLPFERPGYVPVRNESGGAMVWTARIFYKTGSGWLSINPDSGINNRSVQVYATARNLAAGTYEADLVISAGSTGSVTLPVLFTVRAPVVPPVEQPPTRAAVTVNSVTNAANFLNGPVVAGSLATVMGTNLAGAKVAVTFDGLPARLLFNNATQINLQVPADLAGKTSSSMVVTVDGLASTPTTVALATASPAVFSTGILNQDNSVNGASSPAAPGSVIQIFLTGLPAPQRWFDLAVSVKIHDRDNLVPAYAGAAPGLDGVQQVNVAIPGDLPAMTTDLLICTAGTCSHPARVTLGP